MRIGWRRHQNMDMRARTFARAHESSSFLVSYVFFASLACLGAWTVPESLSLLT